MRTIVVDGKTWKWLVGARFLKVVSPTGNGTVLSLEEVTGRTQEEIENGRTPNLYYDSDYACHHEGPGNPETGAIRPRDVRRVIEKLSGAK